MQSIFFNDLLVWHTFYNGGRQTTEIHIGSSLAA